MGLLGRVGGGGDWSALWASLLGAVVGGLFAVVAGYLAAQRAAELANAQAKADRRQVVVGGVKALWEEMKVNFTRYEANLAPAIRNLGADEFLTVNWPVQSDYFSVYSATAGLLGELGDDELAADIIEIVAAAKGLVDSMQQNTSMVERFTELHREDGVNRIAAMGAGMEARQHLVRYAEGLKALDGRISTGIAAISPRVAALR